MIAATLLSVFEVSAKEDFDNISELNKTSYKNDATYAEIVKNPDDIQKKAEKRCFTIVYQECKPLADPYLELLPKSYLMIKTDGETPIPIVFSSNSDKLKADIDSLVPGKRISIYAILRSKLKTVRKKVADNKSDKVESERHFFLSVDDIDLSIRRVEEGNSNISEFEAVPLRRVDIQYEKYIDKKVQFTVRFKDIDNKMPQAISKFTDMTEDDQFCVFLQDSFHFPIIADRENDHCVAAISVAKPNAEMIICGAMRKNIDPAQKNARPVYYFKLMGAKLIDPAVQAPPPPATPPPAPPTKDKTANSP
ncbi:MAG: hypothetical protein A2X49_16185 [Lentisphaerae bacterium GWF2_52_8]|nr:MAG: hypothetical protein A2X49_16185 [Lentisphaerae bacterium GWF2_52_8]